MNRFRWSVGDAVRAQVASDSVDSVFVQDQRLYRQADIEVCRLAKAMTGMTRDQARDAIEKLEKNEIVLVLPSDTFAARYKDRDVMAFSKRKLEFHKCL